MGAYIYMWGRLTPFAGRGESVHASLTCAFVGLTWKMHFSLDGAQGFAKRNLLNKLGVTETPKRKYACCNITGRINNPFIDSGGIWNDERTKER